jgi:hypothetical protein
VAVETKEIASTPDGGAPVSYKVAGDQIFTLVGVRATFDGTGAAGAFLPCVQILSPAGHVLSQTIGSSVAAGASADVSFFPLRRIGTGGNVAPTVLNDIIKLTGPDIWLKLDETSGTTAHDSSGNGHDFTVPVGHVAPSWNNTHAPTGVNAPLFSNSGSGSALSLVTYPGLTGNWTVLGWFQFGASLSRNFCGQGDPQPPGGTGWEMTVFHQLSGEFPQAFFNNATGPYTFLADNAVVTNTWFFMGIVMSGGTVSMYINGAVQSTTLTPGYTATSGIWLGFSPGGFSFNGLASYLMVYGRALDAGTIGSIYSAAPG